jgi:amidase
MDLIDPTAPDVATAVRQLRDGTVTAQQLLADAYARIDRLDPVLHAFAGTDRAAAATEAERADRRRAAGEDGPLLGVPVAVKDDTARAGEVCAHGSRAFTTPAGADAELVRRVRAAGGVVVGATTLPELAIFGVTDSAAHGTTRNPLDPSRTPGGSSGGSAAAVASGMVPLATGSDGAGSIRIPAACCGLVGLKPSVGTVPSSGAWNGLSMNGCLTRTLADTATFLDAVGDLTEPLTPALGRDPGRLRIGVVTAPFRAGLRPRLDPEGEAAVREAAERLAALGHDVVEAGYPQGAQPQLFSARMLAGIAAEAAEVDHPALLERRTRQVAALGRLLPRALVGAGRRGGDRFERSVWAATGVDVLLTPTIGGTAPHVDRWRDRHGIATLLSMADFYAWTPPWNHSGSPALSLPWGAAAGGMPRAVQLVAPRGEDARLVSLGDQLLSS